LSCLPPFFPVCFIDLPLRLCARFWFVFFAPLGLFRGYSVVNTCYQKAVDTINWLLDSDPAIRWQTLRDLTDASPAAIAAERARIPHEGISAEILARQQPDGSWCRA